MSTPVQSTNIAERLQLAEALLIGRVSMLEPQDLPGRYGRVVQSIDRVLQAAECEAVIAGGWAVWRHGYVGRVTQDVDIVLSTESIEEFMRVAGISGFQKLNQLPGRWPKLLHKETDVQVDILPEGARPGRPPIFAPTTIPSPVRLGAQDHSLRYIHLLGLIELKLAAGRLKDQADVVELIRSNREQTAQIRAHLATVHAQYIQNFDALMVESTRDD